MQDRYKKYNKWIRLYPLLLTKQLSLASDGKYRQADKIRDKRTALLNDVRKDIRDIA